jgi:hypothetical protein
MSSNDADEQPLPQPLETCMCALESNSTGSPGVKGSTSPAGHVMILLHRSILIEVALAKGAGSVRALTPRLRENSPARGDYVIEDGAVHAGAVDMQPCTTGQEGPVSPQRRVATHPFQLRSKGVVEELVSMLPEKPEHSATGGVQRSIM